jgi:hypothetical protein
MIGSGSSAGVRATVLMDGCAQASFWPGRFTEKCASGKHQGTGAEWVVVANDCRAAKSGYGLDIVDFFTGCEEF